MFVSPICANESCARIVNKSPVRFYLESSSHYYGIFVGQVISLRGDSPGTRYWTKEVLGVEEFPSIYILPSSGTKVVKYLVRRILAFLEKDGPRKTLKLWNPQCSHNSCSSKFIWAVTYELRSRVPMRM